jgi:hypothetical protein
MKTLAKAFIELAAYMESAKFDDPDEAQGAEEVVSWFISEASDEERAIICQVASQRIAEFRAEGAPKEATEFYERFISRVTSTA